MRRVLQHGMVLGVVALPASATADHSHGASSHTHQAMFGAGVALVAASYAHLAFSGDYQGITPSVTWSNMKVAVAALAPAYRLTRNGATYHGLGDAMVHGQVTLVGMHAKSAGFALAVSVPTGSEREGLGMGHVMAMPAAWGSWPTGALTLSGSLGYGRALGAAAATGHEHAGSTVDPMNASEVTWSAGGELALARALRAGVKVGGAVAIGTGTDRVTGGVRVVWSEGRVETAAEILGGVVGEPFNVRGVVETSLHF